MAKQSGCRTGKVKSRPRRGMALILILGMIALTVAASYALLRSQAQTTLLQTHSQTNVLARQAAEAGLLRAIRKMSVNDWGGVGSSMNGNCDSQSSYAVTFTAGDATLSPTDPSYSEYPFRVTVVSTGTALNLGDSTLPTTYTMTAVVQLVRRALNTSATPTRWSELNGYTCYQWNSGVTQNVDLDLPIQIQGNAAFMGKLKFVQNYPNQNGPRQQLITDLKLIKDQTGIDHRPFTGTVALASGRQDSSTAGELSSWLGLTVTSPTPVSGHPWAYVSPPTTYQLYAGGPTYSIGNISDTYGNSPTGQVIGPNVLTNPLGVYTAGNDIDFKNGTKFTGILFADNNKDVTFDGTDTELNGISLSLDGTTQAYQIPALLESDQLIVKDGTGTTVRGLVICWRKFVLNDRSQGTIFNVTGRLFADQFDLGKCSTWNIPEGLWNAEYGLWDMQDQLPLGVKYFPTWMDRSICDLQLPPRVVFAPPTNIGYHWPDWNQPIFTTAAGDYGLRWEIVSWKDGP